ncbi:MAG: nucleotidyltransferase substrate binding protein [Magnetococcales bacterium]|nr:nucleotidyltransferase substrate binding protein [Magnetococcales bacterium]
MAELELDLSSLTNAVERFAEGLEVLRRQPDNTLIRDGVIQRFEFTYELAHKALRRYLKMTAASRTTIDDMVFQDLIRTGNEQGLLLNDWETWKGYRQSRTDTSHTHHEEKALKVIGRIPSFLEETRFLLEQLRKRTRQPCANHPASTSARIIGRSFGQSSTRTSPTGKSGPSAPAPNGRPDRTPIWTWPFWGMSRWIRASWPD